MCKSLTNYFPRDNDFLVTYFGKTQIALSNKIKKSDWQQQIEKVFDRRNNPQYHDFAFSKISLDKLIEACEQTEFKLYDTSKWYRSADGYQWLEPHW